MTSGMRDYVISRYDVPPEKIINLDIPKERIFITPALRAEAKTKAIPPLEEFVEKEFAALASV